MREEEGQKGSNDRWEGWDRKLAGARRSCMFAKHLVGSTRSGGYARTVTLPQD